MTKERLFNSSVTFWAGNTGHVSPKKPQTMRIMNNSMTSLQEEEIRV